MGVQVYVPISLEGGELLKFLAGASVGVQILKSKS